MTTKEKLILELHDLPVRAEKLSSKKIKGIFGGCGAYGDLCNRKDTDCCDGLKCTVIFNSIDRCY